MLDTFSPYLLAPSRAVCHALSFPTNPLPIPTCFQRTLPTTSLYRLANPRSLSLSLSPALAISVHPLSLLTHPWQTLPPYSLSFRLFSASLPPCSSPANPLSLSLSLPLFVYSHPLFLPTRPYLPLLIIESSLPPHSPPANSANRLPLPTGESSLCLFSCSCRLRLPPLSPSSPSANSPSLLPLFLSSLTLSSSLLVPSKPSFSLCLFLSLLLLSPSLLALPTAKPSLSLSSSLSPNTYPHSSKSPPTPALVTLSLPPCSPSAPTTIPLSPSLSLVTLSPSLLVPSKLSLLAPSLPSSFTLSSSPLVPSKPPPPLSLSPSLSISAHPLFLPTRPLSPFVDRQTLSLSISGPPSPSPSLSIFSPPLSLPTCPTSLCRLLNPLSLSLSFSSYYPYSSKSPRLWCKSSFLSPCLPFALATNPSLSLSPSLSPYARSLSPTLT